MSRNLDDRPTAAVEKVRSVGEALARTLRAVLEAIPDRPTRPSQLSRRLGLNRATSSKILGSLARTEPLEVLHSVPGPEPLRGFLEAAAGSGVAPELTAAAGAAVERFEALIRDDAGTRGALDAIISSNLPSARERFELASKYSIFKGMSQLKGVRADVWLGTAVVTPSSSDVQRHNLTWLTGAFNIQRLRSDVTIGFSYRALGAGEAPEHLEPGRANSISDVPLEEFCVNAPAEVLAQCAGDVIHYTLPGDSLGPRFLTDMLVVDDHQAVMRRHAKDQERKHSSLFVEPAFPVSLLVFDVLFHDEAFPGAVPELIIYDTGTKGLANVNDASRDIDRMPVQESVESLGRDLRSLRCEEVPRYPEILARLADHFGWDPAEFRCFRCRMQYPVYGWQISMSFQPPPAGGS